MTGAVILTVFGAVVFCFFAVMLFSWILDRADDADADWANLLWRVVAVVEAVAAVLILIQAVDTLESVGFYR